MVDNKNSPDYMHTCTVCKRSLPNKMYNRRCPDGGKRERLYQSRCRECSSKISKDRKKQNKDKMAHKRWKLRYLYGLTYEQYTQIYNRQNGQCAICGAEKSTETSGLCVDHCHETGKIRGLLCKSCNLGIANLKHSISNLSKAIEYLS